MVSLGKRQATPALSPIGALEDATADEHRLGTELQFDGRTERFKGNGKANKMLKRRDRKGFKIPNLGKTGVVG